MTNEEARELREVEQRDAALRAGRRAANDEATPKPDPATPRPSMQAPAFVASRPSAPTATRSDAFRGVPTQPSVDRDHGTGGRAEVTAAARPGLQERRHPPAVSDAASPTSDPGSTAAITPEATARPDTAPARKRKRRREQEHDGPEL